MPGLGNHNQQTPKQPWEMLGITKEEYDETNRKTNEFMQSLVDPIIKEFQEATAKYEPVIKKLTDTSFAALFKLVEKERTIRMVRLYQTVPGLAQHAMNEIAQQKQQEERDNNN